MPLSTLTNFHNRERHGSKSQGYASRQRTWLPRYGWRRGGKSWTRCQFCPARTVNPRLRSRWPPTSSRIRRHCLPISQQLSRYFAEQILAIAVAGMVAKNLAYPILPDSDIFWHSFSSLPAINICGDRDFTL